MAASKYLSLNKNINPFNKNVRTSPSTDKKGSVMFNENNEGIIQFIKTFEYDYYELSNGGYYDIEDNQYYYRIEGDTIKQSWSVNNLKK